MSRLRNALPGRAGPHPQPPRSVGSLGRGSQGRWVTTRTVHCPSCPPGGMFRGLRTHGLARLPAAWMGTQNKERNKRAFGGAEQPPKTPPPMPLGLTLSRATLNTFYQVRFPWVGIRDSGCLSLCPPGAPLLSHPVTEAWRQPRVQSSLVWSCGRLTFSEDKQPWLSSDQGNKSRQAPVTGSAVLLPPAQRFLVQAADLGTRDRCGC